MTDTERRDSAVTLTTFVEASSQRGLHTRLLVLLPTLAAGWTDADCYRDLGRTFTAGSPPRATAVSTRGMDFPACEALRPIVPAGSQQATPDRISDPTDNPCSPGGKSATSW